MLFKEKIDMKIVSQIEAKGTTGKTEGGNFKFKPKALQILYNVKSISPFDFNKKIQKRLS